MGDTHHIRGEQREKGRTLGRELLEREFKKAGKSLSKAQKSGGLARAASELRLGGNKEEDLLMQVGFGKVTAAQVIRSVFPEIAEAEKQAELEEQQGVKRPGRISQLIQRVTRTGLSRRTPRGT